MTETPPWCSSSWVDLSKELSGGIASPRTTPIPFGSESDYMRMLREAQSETSCRASARVSPITSALMSQNSTCRNSPTPSPKSPPNSPNAELADLAEYHEDLSGIYINRLKEPEAAIADFMWDWSSRPNMLPPTDWKLKCQSSKSSSGSIRYRAKPAKSKYSKKVVYTMVLSNILSLIIGAGIGMWLYRKSGAQSIKIFI
eukprot:GFUD01004307.1.p1 GENE.GFUD01004307.1~~GFUD01004307.1.p1  ORF type:complete len:200 (+),score=23.43 GFUD01004307.1:340-939(+)